jgi:hypothetical protein
MHRITPFLARLVLAFAALPAMADDAPLLPREKLAPADFPATADWIAREMAPGGRFQHVTPRERDAVEADLGRMQAMLAGVERIEALDESARVELLNAQERVNGVLSRRDGERLICERRARLGSNRRETWCETYAEREARIRGTRERANELNRRIQQCDDSGRCVSG